jgi:hypothetical protein
MPLQSPPIPLNNDTHGWMHWSTVSALADVSLPCNASLGAGVAAGCLFTFARLIVEALAFVKSRVRLTMASCFDESCPVAE